MTAKPLEFSSLEYPSPAGCTGPALAAIRAMKSISFKASQKGNGYITAVVGPANHTEALGVNKVGVAIASTLLLLALGFIAFMALILTK
jgi:hypothetical protein